MAASTKAHVEVAPGRASFVVDGAAPRDMRDGEPWALGFLGPDAALLVREDLSPLPYFAGSLEGVSMAEVFGFIVSGVRSGRLWVQAGPARKAVAISDGQVVFASSTQAHERLGSAVVRLGLLPPDEVEASMREVKPGTRLGQVLERSGKLTAPQLYSAMSFLVREIVLNLFELDQGEFIFFDGEPPLQDALRLPERTRELVLEGMTRAEQMLKLRRKWPSSQRLRLGDGDLPDELPHPELAQGLSVDVGSLRAVFEGSEHGYLTLLDDLLERGVLVEEEREETAAEPMARERGSVTQMYQGLIVEVAQALIAAGKDLSVLRAYLAEPGPRFKDAFAGVTLSEDGELDVARLEENLRDEGHGAALERAQTYSALDSFLSYALFSAQNAVAAEEFRRLQEAVKTLREGA